MVCKDNSRTFFILFYLSWEESMVEIVVIEDSEYTSLIPFEVSNLM